MFRLATHQYITMSSTSKAKTAFLTFALVMALSYLENTQVAGDIPAPNGCNPPNNVAQVNLIEMRGVWYLHALINFTYPFNCTKGEYFIRDDGSRGLSLESAVNSDGIYNTDPLRLTAVQPGIYTINMLRDSSISVWNYVITFNSTTYVETSCFVRNEEVFAQSSAYVTTTREASRQQILDGFAAAGVPATETDTVFISQVNCLN